MTVPVQTRAEIGSNETKGWQTVPVHGNSKRLCEIMRNGDSCGHRAMFVTTTTKMSLRNRMTAKGLLPIFHCEDPRHVANAHKQITEMNKI